MKFIRILILIALVVSFLPLDAFCEEHHDATEHHHGFILCHASCHGAVLTSDVSLIIPHEVTEYYSTQNLSYEEPSLPIEDRPPISLS